MRLYRWIDRNIFELGRELRLSYLPPLMVYLAAGISSLTGIVGTFFVKDYLGLSAEFLAMLGFWLVVPWTLKMPLGHLVDLIWRWKSILVYAGAALIATGLLIMLALLSYPQQMSQYLPMEAWYVISSLLSPVGYVLQDVVADAMTVEAVPGYDADGKPIAQQRLRLMHTTMQTLGRVAIIGGTVLVAMVNIYAFNNVENMPESEKLAAYIHIYQMALIIPLISVLGVLLASRVRIHKFKQLLAGGIERKAAQAMLTPHDAATAPNWWILGGGLIYVVFTLLMGFSDAEYNQEIVFIGSLGIISFLIYRLLRVLDEDARRTLVGTAIIIFVFRAIPGPGAGASWWQIDDLGFDQQFLSILSLISGSLTLFGMFIFRRFMAERSIAYVVAFLTLAGTLLSLPVLGMFYGLHEWTASLTGGVVDARFIAVIDTALESPLGQIAMIPMLAWIANAAPTHLKATFFAVMASFTNLALSLSNLGTKYLNQIFTITREVKDSDTGVISVPADYSELGMLLITVTLLSLLLPLLAILAVKKSRLNSA
ncbi:MAG: hypothetical protein KZQ58_01710 [gamma proteobacterium symbiont of Bathyaustriella thionipta]|nr:hypothetical protein [gamma proteobacterium symbiont of Bathyaustriella thionipta]